MVKRLLVPFAMKMVIPFFAVLVVIFCTTCQNVVLQEDAQRGIPHSLRIYPLPEHGTIKLSQYRATSGTTVVAYVYPEPGYMLQYGSLVFYNDNDQEMAPHSLSEVSSKYQLNMPSNDGRITAVFVEKPYGTYTVSVDQSIEHGTVYTNPRYAIEETPVKVTLLPDLGYDIVPGSLTYSGVPIANTLPYTFNLPADDVTVNVRFEQKGFDDLLASAWNYLSTGQYDTAASFYEAAYQMDKTNSEARLYSTFAQLASLLFDQDVRSIFSALNISLPGNLEDMICDSGWGGSDDQRWYVTYTGTADFPDNATLPKFYSRFSGWATPFGDFQYIKDLANSNTRETFNTLLFWALISANRNGGFNDYLERVNHYVFGDKFERIAARVADFPSNGSVRLNNRLKNRFGLEDLYGTGNKNIGKAEIDYIFANLYAAKAFFEYLAAYDWTIDLRPFLTTEFTDIDGLDELLDKMFKTGENQTGYKDYWNNAASISRTLPFKNKLLQMRTPSYLSKAKADLQKALNLANSSMLYWHGSSSNFTSDARAERQWARDGIAKAKDALEGNRAFYFPKKLPKPAKTAVWPSDGAADYAVDFAEFFKPGVFTLTNLFTTEWGGRAPSLFKIRWYHENIAPFNDVFLPPGELVTKPITETGIYGGENNVNGTGYNAQYGAYSFQINTTNLRKIFPKGFEQDKYMNPSAGTAYLYEVFPKIPVWPRSTTYFKGNNVSARKLYDYYHMK